MLGELLTSDRAAVERQEMHAIAQRGVASALLVVLRAHGYAPGDFVDGNATEEIVRLVPSRGAAGEGGDRA